PVSSRCLPSRPTPPTRRFMGPPPYAAPELYDGRITTHTDQYALAVTYVELVTGGRAMIPSAAGRPGACPVDFKKVRVNEAPVLTRALDPNWTGRWPSCKALLAALRAALSRPRTATRKLGSKQLHTLRRHSC